MIDKKNYQRIADAHAPKSQTGRNLLRAFVIGGAICALGQLALNGWKAAGLDEIVGNWEVSITYKYPEGISDATMDLGLWNYTFLANGHGSFAGKVYNTDKKDFTYRYDDAKNFIVLKSEGSTSELYVDSISRDSFVLQGTGTSQLGNAIYTIAITLRGRRI
jgi:hypothetical protein